MLSYISIGTVLGLSAGLAPGPLLTLVISETLQHDVRAGVRVAIAPFVTDLPIIVLTLLILARLSHFHNILGLISIAGGMFILYLGIINIRFKGVELDLTENRPRSLQKGILVNVLSPHPYLFWFSVGAPTTVRAFDLSPSAAVAFIVSFYLLLVGTKVVLAFLVSKSRTFLVGRKYILTMHLLGFILVLLAGYLFRDGLQLLGIL